MDRRRKRNVKRNYIPYLIAIIFLTMSVGYSIFTETLNINGSAVAHYVIAGNVLKLGLTQTGGRYSTGATPANFNFVNETLSGNTITINYTRKSKLSTNYTFTLVTPFKSVYPYNMTAGAISTAIVSGSLNIVSRSATMTKTALIPQESGSFTVNLTTSTKNTAVINIKATMRYTVEGIIQYFYYVINIA